MSELAHHSENQAASQVSEKEVLKLARYLQEHIEGQINLADTKAELTLTADAFIGAIIFSLNRDALLSAFGNHPLIDQIIALCALLTLGALLMSILFALFVALPRLSFAGTTPSIFYFGYIARQNKDEQDFVEEFLYGKADKDGKRQGLATEQVSKFILHNAYAKAKIAAVKFARIRWSLLFLISTIVLIAINGSLLMVR
ncbi:MAG TPA: Pycsar system effector family protein [Ktedonobacterales bacterium]|nr:Pycsar system effector family protein [Ktedonobacterales bacterium]